MLLKNLSVQSLQSLIKLFIGRGGFLEFFPDTCTYYDSDTFIAQTRALIFDSNNRSLSRSYELAYNFLMPELVGLVQHPSDVVLVSDFHSRP